MMEHFSNILEFIIVQRECVNSCLCVTNDPIMIYVVLVGFNHNNTRNLSSFQENEETSSWESGVTLTHQNMRQTYSAWLA